jgi:exopolysaccharide biosynthesis polyprenyl glycosylphosphotransferase
MKRSEIALAALLLPMDTLMIIASFWLAYSWRAHFDDAASFITTTPGEYLQFAIWLLPVWLIIFALNDLYRTDSGHSFYHQAYRVTLANSVAILFLIMLIFFNKNSFFSRLVLIFIWLISIVLIIAGRYGVQRLRHYLRHKGIGSRQVLLIGSPDLTQFIAKEIIQHQNLGFTVAAIINSQASNTNSVHHHVQSQHIDEVMIADSSLSASDLGQILKLCHDHNITFRYIPDFFYALMPKVSAQNIGSMPTLKLQTVRLDGWWRIIKRLFDITCSLLALIILSPLLILTALLIKLTSPGPIFYSHERVGRDGQVFKLYKFRSMRTNAETTENRFWTQSNDARVTPLGYWLRRTNIDELPQIYNILVGDMSLVGPRPEQPRFVDQFQQEIPDYYRRHLVKSGLTGWAQVNGLKGDTSISERVRYDTFYIEHWTFWLDLRIIWMTVGLVCNEIIGNKYEYRDRS